MKPDASLDAARLNKILDALNTQVRAVETPAVDMTRAAWSADEIGDRLNKILAGLNKIVICLNTTADRLGTLNKIAMGRECARRAPLVAVLLQPRGCLVGGACSRLLSRRGCARREWP